MNKARSQVKQGKELKTIKTSAPLTCLITGFDPFQGHLFNPSEVVAQAIPPEFVVSSGKILVSVQNRVLPTSGHRGWAQMRSALRRMTAVGKPCLIIMLGLAGKRKNISLERFALNMRDAQIKDNAGRVYSGQPIDKKAPQAFRTHAPLEKIQKYLKSRRTKVEISNFCGTFVCNEIYFRTLQYFEKSRLPHSIMFIHLPLPSAKISKSSQLSFMRSAIIKVIEFNCLLLTNQRKSNKLASQRKEK